MHKDSVGVSLGPADGGIGAGGAGFPGLVDSGSAGGGGGPQEDHTGHGPAQDLCDQLAECHWTLESRDTQQESERD